MQVKTNMFTSYDLTPEEEKAAYTFSMLQLAGIQNVISAVAMDLAAPPLEVDDHNIVEIKRRAMLRGEIEALQRLIDNHHLILEGTKP